MNLSAPLLHELPSTAGGVAAALVWGDKRYLSADQYEVFLATGTLHLAVLSGQNITLLSGMLNGLLSPVSKKIGLLAGIGSCLLYLSLFPDQPPVMRAAIMGIISTISISLSHPIVPLYAVIASVIIMLHIHPAWLTDLSFMLSVGATAGIAILYPLWYRPHGLGPVQRYLTSTALLSLCAQVGIAPVILLVFRTYPLLSIISNVVVAWCIEPIMLLGILLTFTRSALFAVPLYGLVTILLALLTLLHPLSTVLTLRW